MTKMVAPPKKILSLSVFAITFGVAAVASAQQPTPNCPPGSWFCADAQVQGSASVNVGGGQQLQPLPPPPPAPPAQPPVVITDAPPAQPPPVVVYQPAPPPVVYVHPRTEYTGRIVRRRTVLPYAPHEWGFNLRLDGALFGGGYNNNAGMGGIGGGLRYKFTPYIGVEGGVDFVIGRDYNDYARNESAFTVNALLFLNPKNRAQVYLLGGIGWSLAHVTNDTYYDEANYNQTQDYAYFGGQFGVGLEYRASRAFAVNFDLRGFVRGRTDPGSGNNPEFTDPSTGQTTNTSGGALATVGMTFYF